MNINTSDIVGRSRKPVGERQFLRESSEMIKEISALAMFEKVDPKSAKDRIERCRYDPFHFYKTYLPHVIVDEPADWHEEFVSDLQRTDEVLAVTAQRGGAKSALIFAEVLRWVCYRMHKLVVYRLDSLEKAEDYTNRILLELQYNQRLRHDFGIMVNKDAAQGDFVCFDPESKRTTTRIVAFGANMSLRGFINENTRPDVIISEDLQNRESAESEKRTEKELKRLFNDARPALTPSGWKFIVIGNIICSGSLMDQLLADGKHLSVIKRRYPAEYKDDDGVRHSTWETRFPIDLLDKIKADIGDDAYDVEFLCRAVEVGSVFKAKRDIHRWRELPEEIDLSATHVQCDPALSGMNDYTAIGVFVSYIHDANRPDFGRWSDVNGIPFGEGVYTLLIDVYVRLAGVDETLAACYEYFERWNAATFSLDGSVDKEIVFDRFFAAYEIQTGVRLPIQFDKFLMSKDVRIKALQPLMQRKRVLLPPGNNEDMQVLIKQLTRYGKGSAEHDDGPDMLAAGVENTDPQYRQGGGAYIF